MSIVGTARFIVKANYVHGVGKYDYSKVVYIHNKQKVIIICLKHGEFLQTPTHHLMGCGCQVCQREKSKIANSDTEEEFKQKAVGIHGDIYSLEKVKYVNSRQKVILMCKEHGDFTRRPSDLLQGMGCQFCKNKTEGKLLKHLREIYPSLLTQFSPSWIKPRRFDFCIPEHKIILELDGRQHFQVVMNWINPQENFANDKAKEKLAEENDYCVIRLLQEDVYYNRYDWLTELTENIQLLIDNKPTIQNIYMEKNNKYYSRYLENSALPSLSTA
jgi:very-short-patch-repair endonuclease